MIRLIIQVWCTGMGWVDTRHKADSIADAVAKLKALLADDSAWVCPGAPRQARYILRLCPEA